MIDFSKGTLVLDGAMGTMIQRLGLSGGDRLNLTAPDAIRDIHKQYVAAGADIISTNTFNSSGLGDEIRAINRAGVQLARQAGARYVAGSVGPTNRAATISPDVDDPAARNVTYDELFAAYLNQIEGLKEGGADILLFETVFDTLNLKAGLAAAHSAAPELPIMVSATLSDRSCRTLSGQSLAAFVASVDDYPGIITFGLNCGTGPEGMVPRINELAELTRRRLSAHPNAGLPDELGRYHLSPTEFAAQVAPMLPYLSIVGGCCGTTPDHIRALSELTKLTKLSKPPELSQCSSLRLSGLDVLTVKPLTIVGERCNVAGSRKFLRLIKENNYEEALAIARQQVADGAQIIDINMDDALLDASAEMQHFLRLYASDPDVARVPVMVDSSNWQVIELALKSLQGKSIVNSISLKEGEEIFLRKARIIKEMGAAVVVMAFDERGQAETYARKIEIAQRAYTMLTEQCGYSPCDIIFDVNVMAVATGLEDHARYGIDFINAVKWIKSNLPGALTSGGISNLSFAFRGKNALREAMHAVFLNHAHLDMAIVNPASRLKYEEILPELRLLIEDVILARNPDSADLLADYAIEDVASHDTAQLPCALPLEQRISQAIISGNTCHLQADITEALKTYAPIDIISGPLMDGMETVGKLFGEGQMFLPQVVKAARAMNRAVALLPMLKEEPIVSKAKILIATVKGDVHDIGKNIVGIVLSCNNYEVIDLGVMVPAESIVEAVKKENPDILCLSGLITPSLEEMAAVCRAMTAAGFTIPIMVGGATTSPLHTALKLAPEYNGLVVHMPDASQNPLAAAKLLGSQRDAYIAEVRARQDHLRAEYFASHRQYVSKDEAEKCRQHFDLTPITPKYPLGEIHERKFTIDELMPLINWAMLYRAWQVKGGEAEKLRSDAERMLRNLRHYDGFGLVVFHRATSTPDSITVRGVNFAVERQLAVDSKFLSIADYVKADGDVLGVFAATSGQQIYDESKRLASEGDTFGSLLLQALADRLAEASSELLHRESVSAGIRPAMGYPMLPNQKQNIPLMSLLAPALHGRISLTENGAMLPSSTVSGFYIPHPQARYFII